MEKNKDRKRERGIDDMINKLVDKIKKTGAPVLVGLDPMLSYIPEHVKKRHLMLVGKHWKGQQRLSGSLIRRLLMPVMI